MSKNHRDPRKPVLSDWTVHHADGRQIIITQARFTRDDRGGYAFTDDKGPVADFPPGSVLSVMRKEPVLVLRDPGPVELASLADALEGLDSRA